MTGIINIVGEIGVQCLFENVLAQVNRQKEADTFLFLIDSPGGFVDEGDKIKDLILNLNQRTIGKNIGDVASIASSIYMACDHRIWNKGKGVFLIHNPWAGDLEGDADFLKEASDSLKSTENDIEKFLSKRTGLDSNMISNLMAKNEPMNEESLIDLGFVHEFVQAELKAVAKLNNNKMDNKQLEKVNEKLSVLDKAMAKLTALVTPKVKALMLQDASGAELNFPDLADDATPAVGDKANVGEAPADGKFIMPDGSTMVFVAGELTEILPAEADDETEQLKKEIEDLKSQLAEKEAEALARETEAQAKAKEYETEIQTFAKEMAEFKASIKSLKVPIENAKPEGKEAGEPEIRKSRK